jgi:hypothetical protein
MKRILMALGAVFCLMIAAFGIISIKAYVASDQNNKIAVAAVRLISETGSITEVSNIIDPRLLKIVEEPNNRRALDGFYRFGALDRAEQVHQIHYSVVYGEGTSVTVGFVGHFRNGSANITVKLHEHDGEMKVIGLNWKVLQTKQAKPRLST